MRGYTRSANAYAVQTWHVACGMWHNGGHIAPLRCLTPPNRLHRTERDPDIAVVHSPAPAVFLRSRRREHLPEKQPVMSHCNREDVTAF